jgi:hypothetical protein
MAASFPIRIMNWRRISRAFFLKMILLKSESKNGRPATYMSSPNPAHITRVVVCVIGMHPQFNGSFD